MIISNERSLVNHENENSHFHLFLGDINNPLLGFDYSDDCYYIHRMGGDIEVIAVSDKAGEKNYPDKVLDFDKVLELFYKEIEN